MFERACDKLGLGGDTVCGYTLHTAWWERFEFGNQGFALTEDMSSEPNSTSQWPPSLQLRDGIVEVLLPKCQHKQPKLNNALEEKRLCDEPCC
eukprot:2826431-Amphidinium_carterae.1